MDYVITFGMIGVFFAGVILVLQRARVSDKSFTDYAVAGRSFGPFYQAMTFVNTWWPGSTFIAFAGLAAGSGVLGFYALSYTMVTIWLGYLLARRVWLWGKRHNLRTQPDLFVLRYDSTAVRVIVALIGVLSMFPWMVLGMQGMGLTFEFLSFGNLSVREAILIGVALLAIRQVWTIRLGMRGLVLTDMYQGIVAYVLGSVAIVGLLVWLLADRHASLSSLDPAMFEVPGFSSDPGPLYLFAIIFTGAVGGWCWPTGFFRVFSARSVRSVKKGTVVGAPLAAAFYLLLVILALLAASVPAVAADPESVWFILSDTAGGVWLLALAGVVVLAATMGGVDAYVQASGAQIANDVVANVRPLGERGLIVVAKGSMVVFTLAAAILASLNLPALFTLATLSYQGIVQLAVPLFLGIFWKRGNKEGAIAGMSVGFVTAVVLESIFRDYLPWAAGLTSGVVALAVNFAIYMAAAYLLPHSAEEQRRLDEVFDSVRREEPRPVVTRPAASGAISQV